VQNIGLSSPKESLIIVGKARVISARYVPDSRGLEKLRNSNPRCPALIEPKLGSENAGRFQI
jgi:hypothetical protein